MGALGYCNAIIEYELATSLEEADDKVPAIKDCDWRQEIAPNTFEDDPATEGKVAKDVEHEEEDVGEDDVDGVVIVEPPNEPAADDILVDEPSILDVLVEGPTDPSTS